MRRWIMNMGLTWKFLLILIVFVAIMGATGWMATRTINSLASDVEVVAERCVPQMERVLRAESAAVSVQSSLAQAAVAQDYATLADHKGRIEEAGRIYEKSMNLVKADLKTERGRQICGELQSAWHDYVVLVDEIISYAELGLSDQALFCMNTECGVITAKLTGLIDELFAYVKQDTGNSITEIHASAAQTLRRIVQVIAIGALVGFAVGFPAGRSIAVPARKLAVLAPLVAAGDLTVEIEHESEDEMGVLARAIGDMVANLRNVVRASAAMASDVAAASGQLSSGSEETAASTQEVTRTVQAIADQSQEQSSSASETASSAAELGKVIRRVYEGADAQVNAISRTSAGYDSMGQSFDKALILMEDVRLATERNADAAVQGRSAVEALTARIAEIDRKTSATSERITELEGLSHEIGRIVGVIEDIADQTNLLALNAAIEAARAGEQGRGFAVVAEEVRKLAEGSARETRAIADLIQQTREATKQAVMTMKLQGQEVEEGSLVATEASERLGDILGAAEHSVSAIDGLMTEIEGFRTIARQVETSMKEILEIAQSNTVDAENMTLLVGKVEEAVETIAAAAEESAASVEEVSASTEEIGAAMQQVASSAQALARTSLHLQQSIAKFHV